jgi:hypothetical protein
MLTFKALLGSTFTFLFRSHWQHILWGAALLSGIGIMLMLLFANPLARVFAPIIETMQQSPLELLQDSDVLESSGEFPDIQRLMGEALANHIQTAITQNLSVFVPLYIVFIILTVITYLYFLLLSLYPQEGVLQILKRIPGHIVRMISVIAVVMIVIYIPILLLSLLSYASPSLHVLSGIAATIIVLLLIPIVVLTPVIAVKYNTNGWQAFKKNIALAKQHWWKLLLFGVGFSILSFAAWYALILLLDYGLQGLAFVLPAVLWGLLTLCIFCWTYCLYQAALTHFFVELEAQL